MLKKSILALAALAIAGSVTLTPSAPAEASIFCANNSKHARSDKCKNHAKLHADRKAKWAEFWESLRIKPRKKRS